jgi:hypothetical protein
LAPLLEETQEIRKLKPDVVLFDLEATRAESVLFLLEADPPPVLIGINPGFNLVKVWSSRQVRELSVQGLIEVINNAVNANTSGGQYGCQNQTC